MEDPSRIPRVIDELSRTWEGRSDLPLATLWTMLANRGVGWGTTDEELVDHLRALARAHPSSVRADDDGLHLVEVSRADGHPMLLTIDGRARTAVTRDAARPSQPTAWRWSSLDAVRVAAPCRIGSAEGVVHRLGVVERITAMRRPPDPAAGLHRGDVGDRRWLILLGGSGGVDDPATDRPSGESATATSPGPAPAGAGEASAVALLGHGLDIWEIGRRDVAHRHVRWRSVVSCVVGGPLATTRGSGAPREDHGVVTAILPVAGDPL